MRKVKSGLFISLDGVTESPDQWKAWFEADGAAPAPSLLVVSFVLLIALSITEKYQEATHGKAV